MAENRSNGNRPPHAATLPRPKSTMQAKMGMEGREAHAATLQRKSVVQAKMGTEGRPEHRARVVRTQEPHPATVQKKEATFEMAQHRSRILQTASAESPSSSASSGASASVNSTLGSTEVSMSSYEGSSNIVKADSEPEAKEEKKVSTGSGAITMQPAATPYDAQYGASKNYASQVRKALRAHKPPIDAPWFQQVAIEKVLAAKDVHPNQSSYIHLTVYTQQKFGNEVRSRSSWCRFGDIAKLEVGYYQNAWIGKDAEGFLPIGYWSRARGFVIADSDSGQFVSGMDDPESRDKQPEYRNVEPIRRFIYVVLQ